MPAVDGSESAGAPDIEEDELDWEDEEEPSLPRDPYSRAQRLVDDILTHELTDDQAVQVAAVLASLAIAEAIENHR